MEEAACGDGPVEAACNAIDHNRPAGSLVEYKLNAVTGGRMPRGSGQVAVGNLKVLGRTVNDNRPALRLINAINKALMK